MFNFNYANIVSKDTIKCEWFINEMLIDNFMTIEAFLLYQVHKKMHPKKDAFFVRLYLQSIYVKL